MGTSSVNNFRRTAASLLAFAFVLPTISAAGQFDALYRGMSDTEISNLTNWKTFFPGLEAEIKRAFTEGKDTKNFILHTNQAPIAWNITEPGNIEINSINVGYFLNKRDTSSFPPKKLFKLDPESQNVTLTAGNNLIVTPVPVQENGFGYALSVDNDLKTEISAENQIIFMTPVSEHGAADYGAFSIVLTENSYASLRANEIAVFGGVRETFNSVLDLKAQSGIYFLVPLEGSQGVGSTIDLFASQMKMDASNVFIDKAVHVGMRMYTETYHSSLLIGQDVSSGIRTHNVYFNKAINLEGGSDLRVTSDQAVIFLEPLSLDLNASVHIKSKKIGISSLTLDDTSAPRGATAYFSVTKDGYMYVGQPLSVGNKDALTIDLDENSVLSSVIDTHPDGDTYINMSPNSFWYSEDDSKITSLSVTPASYIQLGPRDKSVEIETERLTGEGGIFYLAPNSTGSLRITENSEGNHGVLLASSGASLQDTHYLYHIAVDDASPDGSDKARFELTNGGIIDAGPYEYKLGIFPFKKQNGEQGDSRVWVILGERSLKPTPPDDVITPPAPDTPKPDLPELPFDPDNPPQFDPSEEQPIGLSPAAKLTLASIASGNQVIQFLGTLDDLRSRMGEIRNGADDGLYFLYRHDKSRYHSNYSSTSRLKYAAFTFGGDHRLSANWLIGGSFLLTRGKIHVKDAAGNHSRVNSVGAKLYAAWFGEKDQYIDTVLTVNRYSNKLHACSVDESTSNADYHNYGVGLSVEAGKRFYLPIGSNPEAWFVDPQVQLSYFRVSSASFRFSNDMKVHVDSANSLNGRIGFDFGRSFTGVDGNNIGQVYLRAGVNHDFLGKTKVRMNEFSFKDHSIGTRVYYGIGGEGAISNKFKVFGQINRESGSRLKTDFQVKFGLKYLF